MSEKKEGNVERINEVRLQRAKEEKSWGKGRIGH
jgi:hypothetical protein